ncbi:hypothetical protein OAH07_01380 [Verrucomicrobia bacterium]|nr:hypothetical protein [bacterium]MDB4744815.1 hypothetical protein [Verrucomicrobiota bacterium]MDB4795261.1 hypothetical protein [Verrucomicrobiota bacterium]MDC0317824.1 hypothetical protein [bacterium]
MARSQSDIELVEDLKEQHSQDALSELVNRHSGIFYDIVNHYFPVNNKMAGREEILDDMEFLFYKSSIRYDETKGAKFSTFLGNETKWYCLNYYNKNKKYHNPSDEQSKRLEDGSAYPIKNFIINPKTVDKVFKIIKTHPDNRVHKIFQMRYLDPEYNKLTPWRKVGKNLNLSIQGCINIHNQALDYIRKNLKSQGNPKELENEIDFQYSY